MIHEDAERNGLWEGWVFHDLGGGNFLLFRKEYEDRYNELLADNGEMAYEYHHWHRTALKVLGNPDAYTEDYEEPDVGELRGEEKPEDKTVFVAWKEEGSGLAGVMDDIVDGEVMFMNFAEGVGIEPFYPVNKLRNTEGWIHQDLGKGKHILVNTRYAQEFLMIRNNEELVSWLRS